MATGVQSRSAVQVAACSHMEWEDPDFLTVDVTAAAIHGRLSGIFQVAIYSQAGAFLPSAPLDSTKETCHSDDNSDPMLVEELEVDLNAVVKVHKSDGQCISETSCA